MQLKDFENAIIPVGKLRDYLLDLDHKQGGSKAAILIRIGYRREAWQALERAIREQLLATGDSVPLDHPLEPRFAVDGLLQGPSGEAWFRTVWGFPDEESPPILRTAYPRRRPR